MTNFTASGHQLVTRQRNGKDGRSVSNVDVVYQCSTSSTTAPTNWVTTAPTLPKGYYLWSATKVTYKEADGKTSTEVIGAQCIASADNLKTTVERYAQTTSRTTPPDNSSSAWQEGDTSGVQAKDGYYTWTQTKIVWQDGTITYTTPICITGDKGNTGKDGKDGCIQRVTEWASGIEFHNDEELTSGTRFLDIAVVTESATSFKVYKCLKTHVSSSSNAPQTGTTTEYWEPFNNMAPIYTPLIMAQNALLRLAQTNQIVVTDSNDNVTGGMQGNIAKPIFWIKDPKTQASVEIGFTSNSGGSISPYIAGHNQDIEQKNSSKHAFRIDPLNGSYEFYGKNLQRFLINGDGLTYWDAYGKEMEIDSQGGLTFYGQFADFRTARFELPEGNVYLRLSYKGNYKMFGYVKGTLSKSTGQVTYDLENIEAYEIQNGKIVSVGTYDKDHWAWDS